MAHVLICKARRLDAGDAHGLDIEEIVYAVDASTVDLCLSMFPWANFKAIKAAVRLHTKVDLTGSIAVFIRLREASVHDVNFLEHMRVEPGGIYVFDRGYLDFARLFRIACAGASFVIRSKKKTRFAVCESCPVHKSTGLRFDQVIRLSTSKGRTTYPKVLRRVGYFDADTEKRLTFLTNNFALPALTVAAVYKKRWHIELFFKWIKQNLRIKAFYGTSSNAVYTQIWIAVCAYLLVACLNKVHRLDENLSRILQILSVNIFQKVTVDQLLINYKSERPAHQEHNQLTLNGFKLDPSETRRFMKGDAMVMKFDARSIVRGIPERTDSPHHRSP